MKTTVSLPLRRALALAILAVAVFGSYAFLVRPMLAQYAGNSAAIAQMDMALARYRQLAATLPDMTAKLASLRQKGGDNAGYLQGATETLSGVQIEDRLKTLVLRQHGQLQSAQILPAKAEGKVRRITMHGQMVMNTAGLQRVLYDLESAAPCLFIDNLDVRGIAPARNQDGTQGEVLLDVRFDVYGYMRGTA